MKKVDAALRQLLESADTLEHAFEQLVEVDPVLAAQGMPSLHRHLPQLPDPAVEPVPLGGTFVVFDLEANPDRAAVRDHEIIEIGACKIDQGRCIDRFERLTRPTRRLSDAVIELTGIRDESLAAAIPLATALHEFMEFCEGQPLVAHNGFGYDFLLLDAALAAHGLPPFSGHRLDSLELAHLAAPRAGLEVLPNADGTTHPEGRSLEKLVEWLDGQLDHPPHRALQDAELTCTVIDHLLRLMESDEPARTVQRWLLHQGGHPWAAWLSAPDNVPLLENCVVPPPPRPAQTQPAAEFDVQEAVAPLQPGGALVTSAGRRHRPQQAEMAELVVGALARHERWMIEAPTGTGKTLAYLVPSVAWARAVQKPVVISTHSKLLQDQITSTIHELSSSLGPVNWVLIKGKHNYVSLDALEGALDAEPTDAFETFALAVIVGWVAKTPTGDWDDLRMWALEARLPELQAVRWRLSVDSPPGVAFTRLDELCFFRRALDGLSTADVAVVNHAVLLSRVDVAAETEYVVIDEAHNLEESATGALTEQVGGRDISRLITAVYDSERQSGTLARYARATGTPMGGDEIASVRTALQRCAAEADALAPQVISYVRTRTPVHVEEVEKYGASYHVRPGLDTDSPVFAGVRRSSRELCSALRDLADSLGALVVPQQLTGRYSRRRLEAEIARMGRTARAAASALSAVVAAGDDQIWANLLDLGRTNGQWTWTARRVPIDVSEHLAHVWDGMAGVVLTSATLQVAGSMTHLIGRLGLRHAEPRALGTPFENLSEQQLLVLPDHLPTPRGGLMDEFTLAEADELAALVHPYVGSGHGLVHGTPAHAAQP